MTAFLYQRSLIGGVGRFPAERVAARAAGLRFTPGTSDTAWAHAWNGLPLPCKASEVPGDPGANSREFASPPLGPSLDPPRVAEGVTRSRRLGRCGAVVAGRPAARVSAPGFLVTSTSPRISVRPGPPVALFLGQDGMREHQS